LRHGGACEKNILNTKKQPSYKNKQFSGIVKLKKVLFFSLSGNSHILCERTSQKGISSPRNQFNKSIITLPSEYENNDGE
jgi:hypothetical protein